MYRHLRYKEKTFKEVHALKLFNCKDPKNFQLWALFWLNRTWNLLVELNGISATFGKRCLYPSTSSSESATHLSRAVSEASPTTCRFWMGTSFCPAENSARLQSAAHRSMLLHPLDFWYSTGPDWSSVVSASWTLKVSTIAKIFYLLKSGVQWSLDEGLHWS